MECQKCQFENRQGAKFCLKCGSKLEVQCPQCRKRLPRAAIFCDECGFRLSAASETTDEFTYLEGRCLHYGGTTAYLPFLDILKSCCGIEEGQRGFVVNKNFKDKLAAPIPAPTWWRPSWKAGKSPRNSSSSS